MKRLVVFITPILLLSFCGISKQFNQVRFDTKANKKILYGYCNLEGIKTAPFDEWFLMNFNEYEPDLEVLNNIEIIGGLNDVSITIVMGTWCSDSRREVSRFYKLFESLDYDQNRIKLINVDTKKEAKKTIVSKLNIERVPTFIFFKGKEEIGRIIETPEESLEADMLKIVGG